MAVWVHKKKLRTDNTPDPIEKAFFSNEVVKSISNALTREGNQNVLDEVKLSAYGKNMPAKVSIFLSGQKYAIDTSDYLPFLSGLIPHLNAEGNGIIKSDLPDFDLKMPFLLFEDFNTRGLEGDPLESRYDEINDTSKLHNFYFFWRAYGRSGKLAGKMGSWGVGKSVFPALSKINSFWAVTIRESDKGAFLIGQSVLRTHNLENDPAECGYFPYGYYGKFEDDGFAMPEDSFGEIDKFATTFCIRRKVLPDIEKRETETGVSIIVPFPKNEISLDTIAYATIEQFFYPILLGKLEIDLREEDREFSLTKDTIKESVGLIDYSFLGGSKKSFRSMFQGTHTFANWIIGLKDTDHIKLFCSNPNSAHLWKVDLWKDIDKPKLQDKFEKGIPLAFLIPVKFQPENKQASIRYFKAYIQKDETLAEPENYFIREYLTITGVKSLKKKGVRGIVIIDDKDLVTFFGHAEGPAHTGWHKDNFKVKYENIEGCISFVQRSLEVLYKNLLRPPEGLNKDLLRDFFYIDNEEENDFGQAGAHGEKRVKKQDDIPLSKPRRYSLSKIDGGFRIVDNPKNEGTPENLFVRVAYMRTDSNPLKKYSEFDFDLNSMKIKSENVLIIKSEGNILEFKPLGKNFEISVVGFDKRRDLIVDIK